MSRLRRDRHAMRWARYARRNEQLAGEGDTRGTRGEWKAISWLVNRRYSNASSVLRVVRFFYPYRPGN